MEIIAPCKNIHTGPRQGTIVSYCVSTVSCTGPVSIFVQCEYPIRLGKFSLPDSSKVPVERLRLQFNVLVYTICIAVPFTNCSPFINIVFVSITKDRQIVQTGNNGLAV